MHWFRQLSYKKYSVMIVLMVGFSFLHCYFDLEYSPYMTKPEYEDLNAKNLKKIKKLEAKKGAVNSFKIGLISDVHHYFTETKEVVSIFNDMSDLDFVVVVGDITNQGLLREYEWTYDILDDLNVPFVVLIGNHDCLNYGIDIFKDMFGPLNFTFSFLDVEFICFNNNSWESGDPDYNWLKSTAASSTYAHLVNLSHVPNHNTASGRFSEAEVDLFNTIMSDYFDLAIHGHGHFDSSEEMITGVPRYIIGSPGYGHYMIVTYEDGEFNVERNTF